MMQEYDKKRSIELFESITPVGLFAKKLFKGVKGVENIYIRHTPAVSNVVLDGVKGKLKDQLYVPVEVPDPRPPREHRPQDIIVFIVGGATYAEAYAMANICRDNPPVRIIIGGTHVHNSKSFLEEVAASTHRGANLTDATLK